MNTQIHDGSDSLAATKPTEAKSSASSNDALKFVATEVQMIREMISGARMSDEATKLYLARVAEVAIAVGPRRFHEIVIHIIDNFSHRPTVANFRQLAGLNSRLDPQQESVVKAWNMVTTILARHIGKDGNGNVVLQPHLVLEDGKHREEPVPEIPAGLKETVRMMGGWASLYESWPTYAGQKWSQFLQLYRGEPVTALVKKEML